MKMPFPAEQISGVIRLAWADRMSFEEIEKRTGLRERQVIVVMRRELTPSGFRRWRKRVSGRMTKHRRLWEQHMKGAGGRDFFDDLSSL